MSVIPDHLQQEVDRMFPWYVDASLVVVVVAVFGKVWAITGRSSSVRPPPAAE